MFIAGAVGIVAITMSYALPGVAFLYVAFLLDKSDGELARWYGIDSVKGVYLDELFHLVINSSVFAAFGVCSNELVAGFIASYLYLLVRGEYKIVYTVASKHSMQVRSRSDLIRGRHIFGALSGIGALLAAEDVVLVIVAVMYLVGEIDMFLYFYCILLFTLFIAGSISSYSDVLYRRLRPNEE
ncbi:CDP-alcohol phosphatidyltransferase family protein [Planctomycetales bacterium ZRK34]|nr:CDP-alcohol phosphatidyltransferase family protein [Planctomycetales bacterium ZRK34]